MSGNWELLRAKQEKNDEFYTQYEDIEAELQHYTKHLKGKTVYSNCDDPVYSEFCNYFLDHFHDLGLKRYICSGMGIGKRAGNGYLLDTTGEMEPEIKELEGDGSFDSEECLKFLKEADVVVTNPPFSRFRDIIALMLKYDKKFLLIGNQNAITYRDLFPEIKNNRIWLGASIHNGDRKFRVPDSYDKSSNYEFDDKGNKYVRVRGPRWFTNLDYAQRHEPQMLMSMEDNIRFSRYSSIRENGYQKYDNYDAIEVPYTDAIPSDYDGIMGVPITFMDKYSSEQFEIIGKIRPELNGRYKYTRILIKRKAA